MIDDRAKNSLFRLLQSFFEKRELAEATKSSTLRDESNGISEAIDVICAEFKVKREIIENGYHSTRKPLMDWEFRLLSQIANVMFGNLTANQWKLFSLYSQDGNQANIVSTIVRFVSDNPGATTTQIRKHVLDSGMYHLTNVGVYRRPTRRYIVPLIPAVVSAMALKGFLEKGDKVPIKPGSKLKVRTYLVAKPVCPEPNVVEENLR